MCQSMFLFPLIWYVQTSKFLPICWWQMVCHHTNEFISIHLIISKGFPGGSVVKNLPANTGATGDLGGIPGSGGSPEGKNGNPLQYSCWDNPMDRETWWATVHGVRKSWTWLSSWARMQLLIRWNNFSHVNYWDIVSEL